MSNTAPPPSAALPNSSDSGLSIAAVERETGLAKDTLRVWEKRYGFPDPVRDSAGDRLYDTTQVQQLKLISRLLDVGWRPRKVVGLSLEALQKVLNEASRNKNDTLSMTNRPSNEDDPQLEGFLQLIAAHDPRALRHALTHAHAHLGLARFVNSLVAPLTTAVGEAWADGRFEVYEEHLYTEVITGVLRQTIAGLSGSSQAGGPKVLLTTLPQEQHSLGLLMVESLLALEGCTCVSLGTQTPVVDVAQAARAHHADVVALSFSNLHKAAVVHNSLRELRALMPPATALWVGGACSALYQRPLEGISAVQHLSGLSPLVAQWRHAH